MTRHPLIDGMLVVLLATGVAVVSSGCKQNASTEQPTTSVAPARSFAKAPPKQSAGRGELLEVSRRWDFEGDAVSQVPGGFYVGSGGWEVVGGKDAGKSGHVLLQTRRGHEGDFNVLLSSKMVATDVKLTVEMRARAGKLDQGGGLVWRAIDAKNYYVVRYNPLEDNYRLYFVQSGRRAMIASANVKADKKAWHTLSVTMQGDSITCSLDGKVELRTHDRTFQGAGKVGIWTKSDAVSWFDDLELVGK